MKKKIKDLTRDEMLDICDNVSWNCKKCPIYNKRSKVCPRGYFDTLTSKFTEKEMNKEIEIVYEEK